MSNPNPPSAPAAMSVGQLLRPRLTDAVLVVLVAGLVTVVRTRRRARVKR